MVAVMENARGATTAVFGSLQLPVRDGGGGAGRILASNFMPSPVPARERKRNSAARSASRTSVVGTAVAPEVQNDQAFGGIPDCRGVSIHKRRCALQT